MAEKTGRFEAVAAIIAARLEQAAKEIRELIEEPKGFSSLDAEPLTYGDHLVAKVHKVDNQTRFLVVESLKIKTDAGTIINFLVPKVLEPLKQKHNLNYRLFDKDGILDVLCVYGVIQEKQLKELKSAVAGAFHKAAFGEQPKGASLLSEVESKFSDDLRGLLNFELEEDLVRITPRQYLGSDNFRRIAAIVRDELKGEYVSAGQDSHFRVKRGSS